MEWSVLIIAAICAVTAIAVAYMVDARTKREREQILSAPPDRPDVAVTGSPDYLTAEEVRAHRVDLSPPTGSRIVDEHDSSHSFPCGWASKDFITDPDSREAVLESPIILVAEDVAYMADLVPAIRAAQNGSTGLAIAAGGITADVVTTLAMNALSGRLACVCVITKDYESFAAVVGATVVPALDLRSGYVPDTVFGHCDLWVSSPDRTTVEVGPDVGVAPGDPAPHMRGD